MKHSVMIKKQPPLTKPCIYKRAQNGAVTSPWEWLAS